MKKTIFLLSIICLCGLSAFAQTLNFSGVWTLDKSKSKLDERQSASIESQILKAEQTDKDIKVTLTTKHTQNGMGGNSVDLGGRTNTYTFDGKEISVEQDSEIGKILVKYKGENKDSKLKLQSSRTFNSAMGEITITTKETWELSSDGKKLTIKREGESPRGTTSSELVYVKNP